MMPGRDKGIKQFAIFLAVIVLVESSIYWDQEGESFIIEADELEPSLNFTGTPYDTSGSRVKRQFGGFQFQFPAGWPFQQPQQQQQPGVGGGGGFGQFGQFPGFPGFPQAFPTHAPPTTTTTTTQAPTRPPPPPPTELGTCKTRNGLEGRCATFRSCYPFVFSSADGEEEKFRNPGLAADIQERAGPCDLHTMPNYLIFRADAHVRDNMLCCAGSDTGSKPPAPVRPPIPGVSNPFHPQITMRPPWAIWSTRPPPPPPRPITAPTHPPTTTTTTTTTTTPRPTYYPTYPTQRMTQPTAPTTPSSLYPNWPPPFITHPPSHWPSWVHNTLGTQRTTSTTMAPMPMPPQHHWPPQQQYPTHPPASHPGIMTTPASVTQAPVSSSCGFGKIVGGSQGEKGEFPWLVAIMRHGRQICGGSLIDSQWILSAAHCFVNFQPHDVSGLRIQIGDFDIYSNTDGAVTVRSVTKLVRHTGFSMAILHNDVAMLKLDSPVQFGNNGNNNIQPICLTRSGGYEGTTVTVAGWGGIYEGGPQPAIYRKVNLKVWDNQQCAATYGHRAPGGITQMMVCAGSSNADACRGDSGGPLMRNTGGRWEQIGIVSWGIGCGSYPGVYTRVDKYQDWIANNRRY